MATVSKAVLCGLVLVATVKVLADPRVRVIRTRERA